MINAKLYYSVGSCSTSVFITARQIGLKLDAECVDLSTHTTQSGKDFYTINKKGNVPALVFDDGTVLNETSAILQYLADIRPEYNLIGYYGQLERYITLNELNFVATELHPAVGGLYNKSEDVNIKYSQFQRAQSKLDILEARLSSKSSNSLWLANGRYSVADLYAYIVLTWHKYVGLNLSDHPTILKYMENVSSLDFVASGYKAIQEKPTSTL